MKKLIFLVVILFLASFVLSEESSFCGVTIENKYSFLTGTNAMKVSSVSVNNNSEIFVSGINNNDELKVVKLDSDYQKVWSNIYSGGKPVRVIDSTTDSLGNLIVVGGYNNLDGEFVIKINTNGTEIWRHAVNQYNEKAEYFSSVTIDNENNIYVTGFVLNSSNQHIEQMKKLNGSNGSIICTYNGAIGSSRGERVFYFNNNIYLQSLINSVPKLKKLNKNCLYETEFNNVQSSIFTQTGFEKDGNFYFGASNKIMLLNGTTLTNFIDLFGDSERFFGYSDFNNFIVIAPNYISGSSYLNNKIYFYNFEKQRVGVANDLNSNLFNQFELLIELEKKENELLALFINGNPLVPKNGGALAKITLNECEEEIIEPEICNGIDDNGNGLIDEDVFGLEYGACSVCINYENKLLNPNFEDGTSNNWNSPSMNNYLRRTLDSVYGGELHGKRMRGCWSENDGITCGNVGKVGQDVLIETKYFSDIDNEKLNVNYGCYAFTDAMGSNKDYLNLSLRFYDASNNLISTDTKTLGDISKRKNWNIMCDYVLVPSGTRKVNLLAEAFKDNEQNIDVAFDECFVKFVPNNDTCGNVCLGIDEEENNNYCQTIYQEDANQFIITLPSAWTYAHNNDDLSHEEVIDGNWETYGYRNGGGCGIVYGNYYPPLGTSDANLVWKNGVFQNNINIPNECFNESEINLLFASCTNSIWPAPPIFNEDGTIYQGGYSSTVVRCLKSNTTNISSNWVIIDSVTRPARTSEYTDINARFFYEEGIFWNVCKNEETFYCIGDDFDNASLVTNDDIGLTQNTLKTLVDNNTNEKCEYVCNGGFVKQGNTCVNISSFRNSINYLNAIYDSNLEIEIGCSILSNSNINLFNSKNEMINLPENQIECSPTKTKSVINVDLNEGVYALNAQINQPCEVCNKSVNFVVNKSNQQININDNNILVLIILISFITFLIKRERI